MKKAPETPCSADLPTPLCKPAHAEAHDTRPVLGVKELAERWGIDHKTIREAIDLGQLPAFRVGRRRVLIPLAAVLDMEQGRGLPPEESPWR